MGPGMCLAARWPTHTTTPPSAARRDTTCANEGASNSPHRRDGIHRIAHLAGAAGSRVRRHGVDNFSNSSPQVLNRLETLSGAVPEFVMADVRDRAKIAALFA